MESVSVRTIEISMHCKYKKRIRAKEILKNENSNPKKTMRRLPQPEALLKFKFDLLKFAIYNRIPHNRRTHRRSLLGHSRRHNRLLFPLIVCLGVLRISFTTCSDSNVIKQKPFLWFFVLSNGISTSTIWKRNMQ
ncbi:hypothetical protein PUN28_012973 [Cardiocondyla obscurior]|uniref:Uncharacterized protein n=1 Tax=Cardiocondyla obscurior TaxID=286306 RepID=A0AAW2FB61_9HYME